MGHFPSREIYPSYFKLPVRWPPRSPLSLTGVSSRGFAASPPSCNSNYLGYQDNERANILRFRRVFSHCAGDNIFLSKRHFD
ncbi:hypothetical protein DVA44_15145 [Leclercia sp. W17]|nr:hypothetical protein DVA44_15145 [Leclercia sp. W17]